MCVSPQLGESPWPPLMQQTSLSTSSSHPFSPSFPFLQAVAGLVAGLRESPDPLPPSHLQPASQTTAALPGTSQALDASGNPLQRKKIKGGELLKTKGGRGGGRAQRTLHTCLSSYQREGSKGKASPGLAAGNKAAPQEQICAPGKEVRDRTAKHDLGACHLHVTVTPNGVSLY